MISIISKNKQEKEFKTMKIKKIIATTLLIATSITSFMPTTNTQAALKDLQKTRKAVQKEIVAGNKKNPYGSLMKLFKEDAFKGKNKIIEKKKFKDAVKYSTFSFGFLTDDEYKNDIKYIKHCVKSRISGAEEYINSANEMDELNFPYALNSPGINSMLATAMYGWDELNEKEKIFAIDLLLFSEAAVNSTVLDGKLDMPKIRTYKDLANVTALPFSSEVLRSGVTNTIFLYNVSNMLDNKKSEYRDNFVDGVNNCVNDLHLMGVNISMLGGKVLFSPAESDKAFKEYMKLRDKRIKANKDKLNEVINYSRYIWEK